MKWEGKEHNKLLRCLRVAIIVMRERGLGIGKCMLESIVGRPAMKEVD